MSILDVWRKRLAKPDPLGPVKIDEDALARGAEIEEYNVGEPSEALSLALKELKKDPAHYGAGLRGRWTRRLAEFLGMPKDVENKVFHYKICYSKCTPESAEEGDTSDNGIEDEGDATLAEIVQDAHRRGINHRRRGDSTRWWESDWNTEDYETGEEGQFTLHVDDLTAYEFSLINQMLGGPQEIPQPKTKFTPEQLDRAPCTPFEVPAVRPQERQQKLDALLERWQAEADPAKKSQIEQQIRSLSASVFGRWLLRRAAPDTKDAVTRVVANYKRDRAMGLDHDDAVMHAIGGYVALVSLRRQMAGQPAVEEAEIAELRARVEEALAAGGQERVIAHAVGMVRTANDAKRDYSCVMVNITDPKLKKAFSEITAMVEDDDVYDPPEDEKYGRESHFHATCKYGLHTGEVDDVRPLIEGFGPIEAKITGVSFFRKDDKDYDVLKFDMESEDLARLRKKIEGALENTDEHKEFHCHATIAYLKKGRAEKYCDDAVFAEKAEAKLSSAWDGAKGSGLVFDSVCFSDKDGKKTEIACSEKTASQRWLLHLAKKSRRERQEAKHPDLKRESDLIAENKKKPEAKKPHDFKEAKWTHPNGHPRCLICGGESIIGGRCNVTPSAKDYADFEKELDAEFPGRVERREKEKREAAAAFDRGEITHADFRARLAMTDGSERLLASFWAGAITQADLDQGLLRLRRARP
jgi:hypothetical protein